MVTMHQILLLQESIKHGYYALDNSTAGENKVCLLCSDITTAVEYKAWLLCTKYYYCRGVSIMVTMHQLLLLQGTINHGYQHGYYALDNSTAGENKACLLCSDITTAVEYKARQLHT